MSILDELTAAFEDKKQEIYTLEEFLQHCKVDRSFYASPAERILKAIGEPELVDTHNDPRLSRIFHNRTIRRYPTFSDFFGMEETIERIVSYFVHASQNLEEKKQVLYLLGPVGSAKSSLAERLKDLMEINPFYALMYENEISPIFESPLGLFNALKLSNTLDKDYSIPKFITERFILSPWGSKRLSEAGKDFNKFRIYRY